MVWGLSGTPVEGIPPWNPQWALSGGRYSFRKSAWRWKKVENGVKNPSKFFALKISNMCSKLVKIGEHKNFSSFMPKNSPEVGFKPFFGGSNTSFLTAFVIICVQIKEVSLCRAYLKRIVLRSFVFLLWATVHRSLWGNLQHLHLKGYVIRFLASVSFWKLLA